jgi:hypothetical protein
MKTLNKPIQSLAGNIELYLTPVANIATISGHVVTIIDEDFFVQVITARESTSKLTTGLRTPAGIKYTHKIVATVNGQTESNDALLTWLATHKIMAIIRSYPGYYYRVGTKALGLNLEWDHDSGSDASGFKGYTLTVSGEQLSPAMRVNIVYNLTGSIVLQQDTMQNIAG